MAVVAFSCACGNVPPVPQVMSMPRDPACGCVVEFDRVGGTDPPGTHPPTLPDVSNEASCAERRFPSTAGSR